MTMPQYIGAPQPTKIIKNIYTFNNSRWYLIYYPPALIEVTEEIVMYELSSTVMIFPAWFIL